MHDMVSKIFYTCSFTIHQIHCNRALRGTWYGSSRQFTS